MEIKVKQAGWTKLRGLLNEQFRGGKAFDSFVKNANFVEPGDDQLIGELDRLEEFGTTAENGFDRLTVLLHQKDQIGLDVVR